MSDDILSRVRAHPPVDTQYTAGRWHRDRATWRGVWVETKVLGKTLVTAPNRDVRKFLILGRARSGTTLLTQLLDAHSQVQCDREVLAKSVIAPVGYLERLAAKSAARAYGAKLLSYQMVQVQRMANPVGFLRALLDRNWRLVHLERDTFAQSLSLATAQTKRLYHQTIAAKAAEPRRIDAEDLARRLEWNDMLLDYERECLKDLPHLHLSYEADLLPTGQHQATADRLFAWIGVETGAVAARNRKILPDDPRATIANYDEVARAVTARGLSRLLPS